MFEHDKVETRRGVTRYYLDSRLVGKFCKGCNQAKATEEFHKAKRSIDSLTGECGACNSRRVAEYYARNTEKVKAYQVSYNENNYDKVSARRKKYYQENRQAISERARAYYAARAVEVQEKRARYYEANSNRSPEHVVSDRERLRPDGLKRCRYCGEWKEFLAFYRCLGFADGLAASCRECHSIGRRLKYVGAYESEWTARAISLECYMCGGPYEEIEHVWCLDSGGPDVPRNTLPSCWQCNRGQGGKGTQMLLTYLWGRYGATEASAILRKVVGWGVWPFDQPYVAEDWEVSA